MHYDLDALADFNVGQLKLADTFSVHDEGPYTVEFVFPAERLMRYTEAVKPTFVVSEVAQGGDGRKLYQVCDFEGDWQGCVPAGESVVEAIALELLRMNEIFAHEGKNS